MIIKEYIAIKIRWQADLGYDIVHEQVEDAAFCEKGTQISKVLFFSKFSTCGRDGLSYVRAKNGVFHYPSETYHDAYYFDEDFHRVCYRNTFSGTRFEKMSQMKRSQYLTFFWCGEHKIHHTLTSCSRLLKQGATSFDREIRSARRLCFFYFSHDFNKLKGNLSDISMCQASVEISTRMKLITMNLINLPSVTRPTAFSQTEISFDTFQNSNQLWREIGQNVFRNSS